MEETGEYDLESLFIRLGDAIDSVGAERVVLDTIEALFEGLNNAAILRSELRRLFRWLKMKGVTAIITGERGDKSITRFGLEEYVADCVIVLDHRVDGQMATRRLRIVKYRGSSHGTSEYPFLIDNQGISVLPITSLGLSHEASSERVSSGMPGLDDLMDGQGFFRASTILVSGTAGTGKSSIAGHFAHAATARNERCVWFAFEESPSQIARNMRSIGLDLAPAISNGLLRIHADRPTVYGLEMHLAVMHRLILEFRPHVVVDPVSCFEALGSLSEVKALLVRLIDLLKQRGITSLFTSLTASDSSLESMDVGVSSLMDSWLLLRDIESGAERNRILHILKSRGMAHSNQVREFLLTARGIALRNVYAGPSGDLVLGSARSERDAQDRALADARETEVAGSERALARRRRALDAQIAALRAAFEEEQSEGNVLLTQDLARDRHLNESGARMLTARQSAHVPATVNTPSGTDHKTSKASHRPAGNRP